MLTEETQLIPDDMNHFFELLKNLEVNYSWWTGTLPKKLIISPEILQKLSRVTGFYQRPELKSEVTAYAPVIRYFRLKHCVVTIQEDWDERFLHFE